jgi:hypothetical protein
MSSDRATALEPLWKIEDDLMALVESAEACPDDLRPELEARIAEYIAKEATKVDRVAAVFTSLENVQANAKAEIERLRARQASAGKAAGRLEEYILHILHERGDQPLKGANVTLSSRRTEALVIVDPQLVPDQWKRTTITIDVPKDPIKKALKAGEQVPGVALEQHEHLIRK